MWWKDAKFEEKVSEVLRWLRINEGYSLRDVSQRVGIHQDSLSRLENGQRGVTAKDLWKLAFAYGSSPTEVVMLADVGPDYEVISNSKAQLYRQIEEALPEVIVEGSGLPEDAQQQILIQKLKEMPPIRVVVGEAQGRIRVISEVDGEVRGPDGELKE